MRAANVQASLRIRAVSPEPPLLAHRSSESRGTFRQKTRSLAPLNDWACAVKICHDGMLEDTNSHDAPHMYVYISSSVENVRRIVIYLLTMAVHEHYVIIQCLEFNTHRTMKIGKAKHSFALHCAASKHTIILQNGKNKENKA